MKKLIILFFFIFALAENNLTSIIKQISKNSPDFTLAKVLNSLMYDFEKFKFGKEMFIYQSKDEVKNVFSKITLFLNYPLFTASEKSKDKF